MKAIELFAGAGGLGLGVSKAGFTSLDTVEWDTWCCQTLQDNWAKFRSVQREWSFEPRDIARVEFKAFEGKVDLITGGPPCQPFSLGGKHQGNLDHRDMWPEAVRSIRESRPKAFLFENVKGITRANFALYLNYIHNQLKFPSLLRKKGEDWHAHNARIQSHYLENGSEGEEYRVIFDVLNAANFGVPQKRERVFFVGFRSDMKIGWDFEEFSKNEATYSLDALLWDQVKTGDYWDRNRVPRAQRTMDGKLRARGEALFARPKGRPWRTVRDAIAGLPDPETGEAIGVTGHRFQPGARSYPGHTGSPLDEPAKTLKAGVHGVPGGENMLVREDGSVRYFSVRESARLQTFPDSYQFRGSWSEAMRQLGNAVPVELARKLGKSLRGKLASVSK